VEDLVNVAVLLLLLPLTTTTAVAILAEIELCWNLLHIFSVFFISLEGRKDRHRKERDKNS